MESKKMNYLKTEYPIKAQTENKEFDLVATPRLKIWRVMLKVSSKF